MELADYAVKPDQSKGRMYPDFVNIIRSPFQRDRDRLIHSSAFRKLDGKTQVFAYHEGKNYRTRLTHSIEVAQITRTLCKSIGLNEDLGEAIALGHDIGHPPFGHAGERALQKVMENYGGFDHNIHSLKILTELEIHYPEFPGLNPTWETLEGTVKHHGPFQKVTNPYLINFNNKFDLDLKRSPSLEAQVAAFADDIAYLNHDIEDGFRAGFYSIKDLRELVFIDNILKDVEAKHYNIDDNIRIYAITRNMIAKMVFDLLDQTKENLNLYNILTIEDVRNHKTFLVDFSESLKNEILQLREFLKNNFYTCSNVARMDMKSQKIVEDLFDIFLNNPKLLPAEQRCLLSAKSSDIEIAEVVCTYIANLTDMAALEEHQKLFDNMTRF